MKKTGTPTQSFQFPSRHPCSPPVIPACLQQAGEGGNPVFQMVVADLCVCPVVEW
ncbi:MAG: hypothetical protein U9P80_08830 [Thermodesulfobacteriota bacterium]|nr:hypothetical protein [Thermodesulfobacteriota bacterium]